MAHKVKCAICGVTFDRDVVQAVQHSPKRYSHYSCEPDKELVPLVEKTQDELDLQALKDYIYKLYGKKCNWGLIIKQIKDYHSNLNFTYNGMINSLYWFYEIQHNSTNDSNGGIGILPFIYTDAKKYFNGINEANKKNKDKNIFNFIPKEKIVTIKSPRSERPQVKLFDMDWEDEE